MTEQQQKKLISVIINQCIKLKHPQTKENVYQVKDILQLIEVIDKFYEDPKNFKNRRTPVQS